MVACAPINWLNTFGLFFLFSFFFGINIYIYGDDV